MPQNKHALIRYRALDRCLRNHRIRYCFEDLLHEVNKTLEAYDPATKGIGRSMLYEDLAFLESPEGWNAAIERHRIGRKVYLRYADPDFSIQNSPLNDLEIAHLQEAVNILRQFKGLPQFDWLEEITAKINAGIHADDCPACIAFDSNPYLTGIHYIGDLYEAIRYRRTLCVTYRHFQAPEPYEIRFHPYFLKQYNNRWFCFGHCADIDLPLLNLALDRICGVAPCDLPYTANTTTDFEAFFEDLIGVTRPEGALPEKISLWVAPDRAGYIRTKPLHGSQTILSDTAEGLHLSLEVIINPELVQLLLSFGASIRILSPTSLQNTLLAEARAVQRHYSTAEA